jgi:precorrin isomerase
MTTYSSKTQQLHSNSYNIEVNEISDKEFKKWSDMITHIAIPATWDVEIKKVVV